MNPLYEPFPDSVFVGGEHCRIKTDFRAVLHLLSVLEHAKDQRESLVEILGMYKDIPKDLTEAVKAITDFIAGETNEDEEEGEEEKERKKTISYEKDAPYIIGDFLHYYGIDLTSCRYMHWQKFQLLLQGLSEDSETKKRISYRCIDAGKIKDRHERARILRIQRRLSLEEKEADAFRIGDLFASTM
jgi:hypothetical protein